MTMKVPPRSARPADLLFFVLPALHSSRIWSPCRKLSLVRHPRESPRSASFLRYALCLTVAICTQRAFEQVRPPISHPSNRARSDPALPSPDSLMNLRTLSLRKRSAVLRFGLAIAHSRTGQHRKDEACKAASCLDGTRILCLE